jgi:hypothetical protein
MNLHCIPRTFNENSNAIATGYFIHPRALSEKNILQSRTWLYGKASSEIHRTFNLYSPPNLTPVWVKTEIGNCNLSLGLPSIFSISQDAEELLSTNTDFKRDVSGICKDIAEFAAVRELMAVGEIAIFQEDESEPRLFVTYGIMNKPYGEILKFWDEVCKKLAETVPTDTLEKIAIIFDQL